MVETVPSLALLPNKLSTAEEAEVPRDGGPGNGKGLGDFAGGQAPLAQQVEHGTAAGVSQGRESQFRQTCNRMLTHVL